MEKIYLVQEFCEEYYERMRAVAIFSTYEKAQEFVDKHLPHVKSAFMFDEDDYDGELLEIKEFIIDDEKAKCGYCEDEDETELIIQGLEKEVKTLRKLLIEKTAENDKLSKSLTEERIALGKLREEYMDQCSRITKMEDVYYGNDEEIGEYFAHMEQDIYRLMDENRQLRQENEELKAKNGETCIKGRIMRNGRVLIDM